MKTRLRARRTHDEELTTPSLAQHPTAELARPVTGLAALQRTIGNAALQRHLQSQTTTAAPDMVQRDRNEKSPAPASKRTTTIYLTLTTQDGKPIRGTSKRKGHTHQIELLSIQRDKQDNRVRGDREGQNDTTQDWHEGRSVMVEKKRIGYQLGKAVDVVSPELIQFMNGKPLKMRIDFITTDEHGAESQGMTIELDGVMVVGYSTSGHSDDPQRTPMETLSIEADQTSTTMPEVAKEK
ncbi:MAG: type VI secretion system tube protein Hcp [Anaerolineae bacterium]|nr:type VI secretion system tube protein Hcp [Anaerolineae bacterium]